MFSSNNLSGLTNSILTLPHNVKSFRNIPQEEEHHYKIKQEEEESNYSPLNMKGSGKAKKTKKNKRAIPKQIDKYTKDELSKMAKKYSIKLSLSGVKKTKQQLFNSLKRKKMI
jgi:hypothetical protein